MQLLFKIRNDIRYKETDKWPYLTHAFWSFLVQCSAEFSAIVRQNLTKYIIS